MDKIKTEVIERNGNVLTIDVTLTKGDDVRTYRQDILSSGKNEDELLANYANEYYYGVFGEYAFEPQVAEVKKPWYRFGM